MRAPLLVSTEYCMQVVRTRTEWLMSGSSDLELLRENPDDLPGAERTLCRREELLGPSIIVDIL